MDVGVCSRPTITTVGKDGKDVALANNPLMVS